jgi:2-polyprenyl-3-methyl-5-hydroxy-6-metoxy-1,4-benzoquinol methylase
MWQLRNSRRKITGAFSMRPLLEHINCPYCNESKSIPWARENGFTAVKCSGCGIVYVNPRPILPLIYEAVQTGVHSDVEHEKTAIARHVSAKVTFYKRILASMFDDVWQTPKLISWLDVGAGYGEVVEAVSLLAPSGSKIEGIEPMKPKAVHARARGLCIREAYLSEVQDKFNYVSIINVFSHIPDFRGFLRDVRNVLAVNGEIFIETGNAGDLKSSHDAPAELDLPDHLVFAGEQHIIGYLSEAGFSTIKIRRMRKDGMINLAKNIVKKIIGRQVSLSIPYKSPYRSILIRAKLLSL